MNQTIPDLHLQAASRIFGKRGWFCPEKTYLLYGPSRYNKQDFEDALPQVPDPRGDSPLDVAFKAATKDLGAAPGRVAVILFSDGSEDDMNHAKALEAAKALKVSSGDHLCLHTVAVGGSDKAKAFLAEIARSSGYGFSPREDELASPGAMASFVERISLAPGPPKPAEAKPRGRAPDQGKHL